MAETKEKIIYKCEPHWIRVKTGLFFSVVFALEGMMATFIDSEEGLWLEIVAKILTVLFCFGIAFGLWKFSFYLLKSRELILTDRKIYGKTGIITKRTLSAPISKIQTVRIRKTIGGKIFGYSDLEIHCITGVYWFKKQKNAEGMQKAIFDLIKKRETATGDSINPYLAEIAKNTRRSGR